MKSMRITVTFFLFLLTTLGHAQEIFPNNGLGSYNLTEPPYTGAIGQVGGNNIWRPIGNNRTDLHTKGPNYTGPIQTHTWWGSALWNASGLPWGETRQRYEQDGVTPNNHSEMMFPHPLIIQADHEGMILRYRPYAVGGADGYNIAIADQDLIVGVDGESFSETSVDGYGDWHATFRQEGSGNVLLSTSASGSPYVYFERQGLGDIHFRHQGGLGKILAISTSGNSLAYYVQTSGNPGRIFGVFMPPNTGWTAPGTLVNSLTEGDVQGNNWNVYLPSGSDFFSVAILPDEIPVPIPTSNGTGTYDLNLVRQVLDKYEQYAFNFISETNHSYVYDETGAQLTTTFETVTSNVYGMSSTGTMMGAYLHQARYSPEAVGVQNTGYTYVTPRKSMVMLETNTFTTEHPNLGILPTLGDANTGSNVELRALLDNWMPSVNPTQDAADGYNKDDFAALSNNVQIADKLGDDASRDFLIGVLRDRLTDWFSSPTNELNHNRYFAYSSDFNWMAHYPSAFGSSGIFVDAHFHIGYLIQAAAILARYDPAWAMQYGDMVNTVIRSINDYRKDQIDPGVNGTVEPWFPYLRYFDPYAGHSWAGPDAGDQESISEALQFASGTFLWGETTQNNEIRDLGALLYITESVAGRMYWYDMDDEINRNAYNSGYDHQHGTIIRNRGTDYATFFSADCRWMHSITIVPEITPLLWMTTNSLGAQRSFNGICNNGGADYPNWDDHGGRYAMLQAAFDGSAARTAWETYSLSEQWINPTFPHVNGNMPITYEWIHMFDSVGVMNPSVRADITGYHLFEKDSCSTWYRHYMMYNPPGDPMKVVHFTDGTCWTLPEDTVITYALLGPDSVGELHAGVSQICNDSSFDLTFDNFVVCDGDTTFLVQHSSDNGASWTTIYRVRSGGDSLVVSISESIPGDYLYRAIMLNEYNDKPEMTCDLNDTSLVSQYASVQINSCGCSTPLSVVIDPISDTVLCDSGTVLFSVISPVQAGIQYDWMELNAPSTPVASGIDLSSFSSTTVGDYFLRLVDPNDPSNCTVNSDTVSVSILSPLTPTILIDVDTNNVCLGVSQTFTATTNVGGAEQIEWRVDNVLQVTTGSTFTTSSLVNGQQIEATLTSSEGCITNAHATSNSVIAIIETPRRPSVTISGNSNLVCAGDTLVYAAAVSESDYSINWFVNSVSVGVNNLVFSSDSLNDNDQVTAQITSSDHCISQVNIESNVLVASVKNVVVPTVIIDVDTNGICVGEAQVFRSQVAGGLVDYDWKVNGISQNIDSVWFSALLDSGDIVHLAVTSLESCGIAGEIVSNNVIVDKRNRLLPSIIINVDSNNVCEGSNQVFSAITKNEGLFPQIEWRINSVLQVDTGSIFSSNILSDGDIVEAFLISSEACTVQQIVSSVGVVVIVEALHLPEISISGNESPVCVGQELNYTALTAESNYSMDWLINSIPQSHDSVGFKISNLVDGDQIQAQLTSRRRCVSQAVVVSNVLTASITNMITPAVTILVDTNGVCEGQVQNFTSIVSDGTVTYNWLVDGISVSDQDRFSSSTLDSGALVRLDIIPTSICASSGIISSPSIEVVVHSKKIPTLSLMVDTNDVCIGTMQNFYVQGTNLGNMPNYRWLVNGQNQGQNQALFNSNGLRDGDQVEVIVTSNQTCVEIIDVFSNTIDIKVNDLKSPSIELFGPGDVCVTTPVDYKVINPVDVGQLVNYEWLINNTVVDTGVQLNQVILSGNDVLVARATNFPRCSDVDSLLLTASINFFQQPVVMLSGTDIDLCEGDSVLLKASTTEGQISWYKNGQLISMLDSSLTVAESGSYSFAADNGVCVSSLSEERVITAYEIPDLDVGRDLWAVIGDEVTMDPFVSVYTSVRWEGEVDDRADPFTTLTIMEESRYVLSVENGPCSTSDTINVFIIDQLMIPNAFSPNGDGVNDVWLINGIEAYPMSQLKVFNRWGNVVYEEFGGIDQFWDGGEYPTGTYYYVLNLGNTEHSLSGKRLQGSVTITK